MAGRQIPGGQFINETGAAERHIPGGPFVNETTSAGGAHTVAVGQVSETDTAQALGKQKLKALGLVTETETAQPITAVKRLALGLVSEADSAQALTSAKRKELGLVVETDTAQPITAGGALGGMLGLVEESDTALPITARKQKAIGYATESEFAQAVAAAKARGVLLAEESDSALSMTRIKRVSLGLAQEVDSAFSITVPTALGATLLQGLGARMLHKDTAADVMVFMRQSADHLTAATGLTLTCELSRDGSAFATISPTVAEIGNGWYLISLTASHTDTLGDLVLHVTATGADPSDVIAQVDSALTAIKAKTDNLPASPAAVGDIPSAAQNADAVWAKTLP